MKNIAENAHLIPQNAHSYVCVYRCAETPIGQPEVITCASTTEGWMMRFEFFIFRKIKTAFSPHFCGSLEDFSAFPRFLEVMEYIVFKCEFKKKRCLVEYDAHQYNGRVRFGSHLSDRMDRSSI